jgi:hypothetical protein
MSTRIIRIVARQSGVLALCALWGARLAGALAGAQELEPGVQTSSAAAPAHAGAPKERVQDAGPASKGPVSKPASAAPPATAGPASTAKPAPKASDRIELGTTQISGNRELPKVMYVVPWRRADPGDFSGRPPNSLLDEALTPVDRDVFRRQNRYYGVVQEQSQAVKSQGAASAAGSTPLATQDEK